MFERIRKWQDEYRQRSRIAQMDDADFHDIGVSRDELESIVGIGEDISDRQLAMGRRHGLDERALHRNPQDLVASIKTCASCGKTGECAIYLASDAPASTDAEFCPNHDLYQQLAQC